jgi:catalase
MDRTGKMTVSARRRGVTGLMLIISGLSGAGAAFGDPPAAATPQVTPIQMIQAFEDLFGPHPGLRKTHAKGVCAAGQFVGTADARILSRSPLFSGSPVPVIARFSLGSGNPDVADAGPVLRGMALEFHPGGGGLQHMTMLDVPVFAASTPDSFHDALVASKPDPKTGKADPDKMAAFAATHPDAKALPDYMGHHGPTANYYQSAYFSIHTFFFIDAQGTRHAVRWRFVPRGGVKELAAAQVKTAPHDFLEGGLIDAVHKGPVVWDMIVYVGEPGDSENNPTVAWPETRRHFTAGTLTLSQATPQQKGAACEPINFDPLVMADGIAPSSDPILLFRSSAYGVSYGKRLSGN